MIGVMTYGRKKRIVLYAVLIVIILSLIVLVLSLNTSNNNQSEEIKNYISKI